MNTTPPLFPLISADELSGLLSDPSVRVLDGSWHLDGRYARAEFETRRIAGARFFDLEAISDSASDLPHMLPSPEAFARAMGDIGVSETDRIVVYDAAGLFSAARVWWMLRVMGAERVQVLDGGLPRWMALGLPVDDFAAVAAAPCLFTARFDATAVASLSDVREALRQGIQVADARGRSRFNGQTPEPRPGVRSGHMPGALNLPYSSLLTPEGELKRDQALRAAFAEVSLNPDAPMITTCGSGVTAAIINLALGTLGRSSRLYDGSWSEWGRREDTPIAAGD